MPAPAPPSGAASSADPPTRRVAYTVNARVCQVVGDRIVQREEYTGDWHTGNTRCRTGDSGHVIPAAGNLNIGDIVNRWPRARAGRSHNWPALEVGVPHVAKGRMAAIISEVP